MNVLLANTPCYVLLDSSKQLGPKLVAVNEGPEYKAIYGFSSKKSYDLFRAKNAQLSMPYPLVKGYIKNRIADSVGLVQLIVVDAAGPQEPQVNAATMNSVLEAMEKKANQVTLSFRLTLDRELQAYGVEKALPGLELASRLARTQ